MKNGRTSATTTVLVVEDNALALRATMAQVESLGYKVLSADDGPKSLEVIDEARRIDLLISDVVMPGGMTGQELANEAQRRIPAIKVVLISAYPRDDLVSTGRVSEDTPLLTKPFGRADLERMIQHVMGSSIPQKQ